MTDTLLVAGIPRSGSTWTASVLAAAPDACLVSEPDNAFAHPYALRATRGLGPYPSIPRAAEHARITGLWRMATAPSRLPTHSTSSRIRNHLARRLYRHVRDDEIRRLMYEGGRASLTASLAMAISAPARPSAASVVLKTVYGAFALEWIAAQTGASVIILQRHPLAVIASRLRLRWTRGEGWWVPRRMAQGLVDGDVTVPADDEDLSPLEWIAWNVCATSAQLASSAIDHPEWCAVDHERLCIDPVARFRALAADTGWPWHPAIEQFIERNNRPGQGYDVSRVASEVNAGWRDQFDARQLDRLVSVQMRFPLLRRWFDAD